MTTTLIETPNREYAKQILELWLDNIDPEGGYYVKNVSNLNRAVSFQQFNNKSYVCIFALLGGRLATEPFLVPRDFWDDMEREIMLREADDDAYGAWALAGFPKSDRFEF